MKINTPIVPVTQGQTVFIQGYRFIATDIWAGLDSDGRMIYRFTGILDSAKSNDNLRHSAYNGGRYGGLCGAPMNFGGTPLDFGDQKA